VDNSDGDVSREAAFLESAWCRLELGMVCFESFLIYGARPC
jgi:hypothetical protein